MTVTKTIELNDDERNSIVKAMNVFERLSQEIFKESGNLYNVLDIINDHSEHYNGLYTDIDKIIIYGSDD